jgi:hypothetical protein
MNRAHQVDVFMATYAGELEKAAREHPAEYGPMYANGRVGIVAEKMRAAFYEGSYNHDGRAIRSTCRALGLKYTRTAIEAFFNKLDPDPLKVPTLTEVIA